MTNEQIEELMRQAYQQREQQQAQQQAEQAALQKAQKQAADSQREIDSAPRHKYALIVAVDLQGGYAKDGQIPWHYKEDFDWFKKRTAGQICVMGRKSYDDIAARAAERKAKKENLEQVNTDEVEILPGRDAFVVSSTLSGIRNAKIINKIWDVEKHISTDDPRTIMILGGEQLFKEAIAKAGIVYMTVVNKEFDCDKFFPIKYLMNHFVESQVLKLETQPDLRFIVWKRK